MLEIFADAELIPKMVKETFEALFPNLLLFEWDPFGTNGGEVSPVGFDDNNTSHVLYDRYRQKRAGFQWRVPLYKVEEIAGQEVERTVREQLIAKMLSAN